METLKTYSPQEATFATQFNEALYARKAIFVGLTRLFLLFYNPPAVKRFPAPKSPLCKGAF